MIFDRSLNLFMVTRLEASGSHLMLLDFLDEVIVKLLGIYGKCGCSLMTGTINTN